MCYEKPRSITCITHVKFPTRISMERIDSRYQSQGTLGKFSQIDSFTRSYQWLQYHHPSYTALVRSNLTVVSRKPRDRQTGLSLRVVSQSPGPVIPNRIATTVDRILMPDAPMKAHTTISLGYDRLLSLHGSHHEAMEAAVVALRHVLCAGSLHACD